MFYSSTRCGDKDGVSSAMAIVKGLADDGGLYVPSLFPYISENEIKSLCKMSYARRAEFILSKFLNDFTDNEINEFTDLVYNKEKFETDIVAPVYKLNKTTYFLELWHGPTCAFKDMALQILPHLLTKSIKKVGIDREVVILVATSGDTGKAALEGFKDVNGTRIIVFYPESGVSEIQKLQMVTQEGNNVDVAAVYGNFDDAQTGVKTIFADTAYNERLKRNGFDLSSANSINWGRLVPQIVYYFSAYADLLKNEEINEGDSINVVVPTGNFGNILAAYYAKKMGLRISKLICASNDNNVLTDFINTGVYDKNREFKTTISPSMDILISSNLERFLYHISGNNSENVKAWMDELKETGRYEISNDIKDAMQEFMYGGFCDQDETMEAIKRTYKEFGYVMDPHTAVGKAVYDKYALNTGDTTKTVIASTASPFKFSKSVLDAIGENTTGKTEFELLSMLEKVSGGKVPKSLADLKSKSVMFNIKCEKDEIRHVIDEFLNI